MNLEWWHWAVLGIALVVAELIAPAFVLVWFGLGAVVVALVVVGFPDMGLIGEFLIWTASSVAMTGLWFKVFKPSRHKSLVGRSSAQIIGETGLLSEDVDGFKRGKVRFQKPLVGSDVWECIADEAITAGARVRVVSVEGSLLKVTKLEERKS